MISLYERIMAESNKKNISGKKLAILLGLKKTPLTDWKNGKSKPTLDQLVKMCDIFATSADYLLFGNHAGLSDSKFSDEQKLLSYYHKMSRMDQEDLLLIAEMKSKKAKNEESSSLSDVDITA